MRTSPDASNLSYGSQRQQVGEKRLLSSLDQLQAEHDVEELDRVCQRQQPPVMQIGRGILDAAQGQRLDRAGRDHEEIVDDEPRRVEPLELEVVHVVVEEGQLRHMTFGAAPLAHKDALPGQLLFACFRGVKPVERVELGQPEKDALLAYLLAL